MTEQEWIDDRIVVRRLFFLEEQGCRDDRLLRLFGCACCRRVMHRMPLDAARRIVELSEAYADGNASAKDLAGANASDDFADFDARMLNSTEAGPQFSKYTWNVLGAARLLAAPIFTIGAASGVSDSVEGDPDGDFFFREWHLGGSEVESSAEEGAQQVRLLLDIFGNPFRATAFDPAWRTGDAVGVALQMYDTRDFGAMPILADALEDAGCTDPEILSHCRSQGVHVRGCWVVDRVLSKR